MIPAGHNKKQNYLIVLCGPTGIGKTAISIEIAGYFKSIIISADSRQLYKEMSIGTAVPTAEELNKVPHSFVQSHSIHNIFNASIYEREVLEFLKNYFQNNQLAFLTGGSGLYIDAVCNGIDDLPAINKELREKWHKISVDKGLDYMQKIVEKIDPEYYATVDRNNPKRLQKAIEIFEMTGKPYSQFLTSTQKQRPFKIYKIGLNTNREELYRRINQRVDKMIEVGLEQEAKKLYPYKKLTPLNTVGYKELFEYFDGKISLNTAVEQIKNHSRAYARRQITWFRKDKTIEWFEPEQIYEIIAYIKKIIDE